MNLTKTVRKVPIDINLEKAGVSVDESHGRVEGGPKYDAEDTWVRAWMGAQMDVRGCTQRAGL